MSGELPACFYCTFMNVFIDVHVHFILFLKKSMGPLARAGQTNQKGSREVQVKSSGYSQMRCKLVKSMFRGHNVPLVFIDIGQL